MNDVILTIPSKKHEEQVMAFREEMLRNGEGFCGCSGLEDTTDYDEWLDFSGRIARLGWTPSITYIGIRATDGLLIGMIYANVLENELKGIEYDGKNN